MRKNNEGQKKTDEFDYLSSAASVQDLTGLIPAAPASSEELEAYEDLYDFLPPGGDASQLKPAAVTKPTQKNHK